MTSDGKLMTRSVIQKLQACSNARPTDVVKKGYVVLKTDITLRPNYLEALKNWDILEDPIKVRREDIGVGIWRKNSTIMVYPCNRRLATEYMETVTKIHLEGRGSFDPTTVYLKTPV
jgi:hypothetical protein